MTTLGQLDKFADKWFNNEMRRRGFAVEKKFIFWRKRGPLYDMFMPQLLSGDFLRIRMSIWSPWVDHADGSLGDFPPSYGLIGGDLSEYFPKSMNSGELFSIENPEDVDASLKLILDLIDKHALPWFPTINSYEDYVSYVDTRGFHPTPEGSEKVRKGIKLAFEREPYY